MKKEWMKKNDRKVIIHELLVAKLQYDFSQHQLLTNISSIKLKIDRTVGAGLVESEFDWLSRIPTEDTSVVVITDRLLKVCTTINVHIDLSVQFLQVPFFQRWTALKVR